MRGRARGFTLIEMVVAIAVFAILGVIASQIVSRVIDNYTLLQERTQRLAAVQRAMTLLERDVLQVANRPVRDQLGDPVAALLIGADGLAEFTRAGWANPLGHARSNLQRVAYRLDGDTLYRAYWWSLDRTPASEPEAQVLLEGVESLDFVAVDETGEEHRFWPTAAATVDGSPIRLAAVIVRLEIAPFGEVERLWPVAAL